jgi:hypothetical protein
MDPAADAGGGSLNEFPPARDDQPHAGGLRAEGKPKPKHSSSNMRKTDYIKPASAEDDDREWHGVVVSDEASYARVIGIASSIAEAREMSATDFRQLDPEQDSCPESYTFHGRDDRGRYEPRAVFFP